VSEVGRGSTAVVWRVTDPRSGVDVALKWMVPDLVMDEAAVRMFSDEAAIASRVLHPNVARVLGTGAFEGAPFIVQDLVEGCSWAELSERAEAHGAPIPVGAHLGIAAQAAEGLHAAHETRDAGGKLLGIVHRDVKPQNILVGFDGRVRVVDFGIAAARDRSTRTATGTTKGTLAYLAPEQILSPRDIDRRVDLWSLAVVTWEALNRRRLFFDPNEGTTIWNVVHLPVPRIQAEGVPDAVRDVLDRCLTRDPSQRPASAAAVAEILESAAVELGYADHAALARVVADT